MSNYIIFIMSIWISWWRVNFIFIFYLILQCPFSFFLLSNKKKEKVRKRKKNPSCVPTSSRVYTRSAVFLCSATPNLFSLANSGTALRQCSASLARQKQCRASSEATSEAKSAGLPAWRKRLSWSEYSCEDVGNICVFSFFSFAVSFLSLPRK